MKPGGAVLRVTVVAIAVLVVDQLSKALIRHDLVPGEMAEIVGPLDLTYVQNHGVAFGFAGGGGVGIVLVTVVILVALGVAFARNHDRRLIWIPTGLIAGGAIGNLIDRIRIGSVTDFVKFPHWPAFNVADMAITVGVIALAIVLLSEPEPGPESTPEPETRPRAQREVGAGPETELTGNDE